MELIDILNQIRLIRSVREFLLNPALHGNIATILILAGALLFAFRASRREYWRNAWRQVRGNRMAMLSLVILSAFFSIAVIDSISWRDATFRREDGRPQRDWWGRIIREAKARSLLDRIAAVPVTLEENQMEFLPERIRREHEPGDRIWIPLRALNEKTYSAPLSDRQFTREIVEGSSPPRRDTPLLRFPGKHLFGTNKPGKDVLYLTLKGVRTAVIIGILTTLIAVPFAMFFGVVAGYFGGLADDLIVFFYTVLSSIPSILLIIAATLVFKDTLEEVGLSSLLALCLIIGITSWTGLCRLLRGETLKLRELEYVQAAEAFGVNRGIILIRHVVPNLMHLVLISSILRFSGLVMTEAVLSYLNIGVDPDTGSWGHMISGATLELTREPIVWWGLTGSFIGMFLLVLSVNLFGDAMRDALDPRLRTR